MQEATKREAIINELYNRYQANGYITEDETLACFVAHKIPLTLVDSITDHLLSIGVLIRIDDNHDDEDEDFNDRTRTDYESIFFEVLQISPELIVLVDYIRTIKPPQHREWHNLIPQAQNGNQYARDRLFDMYLRVVLKISLKYYKESGYEIDDIIQVGSMGLLQAIKAYDFSKHGSFVSYMPLWIAQYISRAISDLSRAIRIPVHMIETMRTLERAHTEIKLRSVDDPSIEEIANFCNMSSDSVEKVIGYFNTIISIEEFLEVDVDGFCSYQIEDTEIQPIEDITEGIDLRQVFLDLLDTLKEREADIIRSRFGFDDDKPKTLEEVGEKYGVTRERIRQIEAKALRKLKHPSRIKKLSGY